MLLSLAAIGGCFLVSETSWQASATAASSVPIDSACTRQTLRGLWRRDTITTGAAFDAAGAIRGIDFQSGGPILFRWIPDSSNRWLLAATAGYGGHGPAPDSVSL